MGTAWALTLFLAFAAGNFGLTIFLASVLGPKRRNPVKDQPYETGSLPLAPQGGRVHVHFYLVAMLFILFDIETVMLYPWAMVYLDDLKLFGLAEMGLFLGVVSFALFYVWKRGGLEWD